VVGAPVVNFLSRVVDWFTTASHWRGEGGVPHRLVEHVEISAGAVITAIVIAFPIALVLGHLRRGGFLAVNVANVGRALPSLALLILAQDMFGIGARPAYVALVALALPPIMTNTYIGVRDVDADARDAARGMGMSGRQMMFRVELPLALPLIVAGVRTAAVNVVATATLAAIIAGGGLGRFIVDGLAQQDTPQAFAGALLVAALAVLTEVTLGGVQRRLTARSATVAAGQREEELLHALVP
jgi:osmoprotectant transport system permease protein